MKEPSGMKLLEARGVVTVSDTSTHNLSRRHILKTGLAFAVGVVALGPRRILGEVRDDCTRWAFLSDTHIAKEPDRRCRGFYPYRNLLEITARMESDLPDGLVVTGDLAKRRGQIEAYDNLKVLLAPIARKRPVENRHIVTVDTGPVRLVVLDTLYFVNMMPGLLGRSQRTWLETLLYTCDERATILCFHHTPKVDLLDTGRFFDIIGPMTKVKAIVYGHSHKYAFSQYKGIHLINLPATAFNFSRRQPVGWVEAQLTPRGGQFTLHAIGGDLKLAEHTEKLRWRV
jgi:3',5'-cyclic-AMP phosphodiesterase